MNELTVLQRLAEGMPPHWWYKVSQKGTQITITARVRGRPGVVTSTFDTDNEGALRDFINLRRRYDNAGLFPLDLPS